MFTNANPEVHSKFINRPYLELYRVFFLFGSKPAKTQGICLTASIGVAFMVSKTQAHIGHSADVHNTSGSSRRHCDSRQNSAPWRILLHLGSVALVPLFRMVQHMLPHWLYLSLPVMSRLGFKSVLSDHGSQFDLTNTF